MHRILLREAKRVSRTDVHRHSFDIVFVLKVPATSDTSITQIIYFSFTV